jgi:hypothetical protein
MTEEHKLSRDEVAAWVMRTRRAQGLPDRVESPAVLAELAKDVVDAMEAEDHDPECK